MERLVGLQPATCPFWLRFPYLAPKSALLACRCFITNRQKETPVSAFPITQYSLRRCNSLHTVRLARPHQLDTPATTQSFEPSRDFRMFRAIDKITCTQTVQIDAMRQHTLHNTEFLGTHEVNRAHPSQTKATQNTSLCKAPRFRKEHCFFGKLAGFARLSLC